MRRISFCITLGMLFTLLVGCSSEQFTIKDSDASSTQGKYLISGTLQNNTADKDSYVVIYDLFDSTGNVIGCAVGSTETEIGKGEESHFGAIGTSAKIELPLTKDNFSFLYGALYSAANSSSIDVTKIDHYSEKGIISSSEINDIARQATNDIRSRQQMR